MINFYFLDSSALVKRYVPETGSAWVQSMTATSAGNPIAIAQIAWVEVFSALSRRRREGTLSADELDIIGQKFHNEFENQYRAIERARKNAIACFLVVDTRVLIAVKLFL